MFVAAGRAGIMRSIASPSTRSSGIRPRGIDTLVLAGISTSGVVLSTAVEATDRDYRLYVLSDGTADPDEQARDVLLGRIFPRRAQIIDTATLRGLLSP